MSRVQKIDVFVFRYPQHYKIGGHEEAPGRFPGTDYYLEAEWPQAYSRVVESCLVKITAENGLVGWGETQAPVTPQTPAALITTLLGPSLLGQDVRRISFLYERMQQLMLARGHWGSFLADAIAGLDNALWDLNGRMESVPIYQMLGGAFRYELKAYVSGLRKPTIGDKVSFATDAIAKGFAGVKLFSGSNQAKALSEMEALRSAMPKESFLALDALWSCSLSEAKRLGKALDAIQAAWFEAPLAVEDIESHVALATYLATPIAVGEVLRTARQFRPWLEKRAMAIVQPDVMRAGISGVSRIAALADAFHATTTLHVGVCTGVGVAATWQVAAALPGTLPQEHQLDLFVSMNSMLKTPLVEKDGMLQVPSKPGNGVEVNEDVVKAMSVEHWAVDRDGRQLMGRTN